MTLEEAYYLSLAVDVCIRLNRATAVDGLCDASTYVKECG